jgi:hypothetical protein
MSFWHAQYSWQWPGECQALVQSLRLCGFARDIFFSQRCRLSIFSRQGAKSAKDEGIMVEVIEKTLA